MKTNYLRKIFAKAICGMTLVELLVSISIGAMLFTPVLGMLFDATRTSADNSTIQVTERQVHVLSDMLVAELRNIGSGMPLGQTSFGYSSVGAIALPVLPASTNTIVSFRHNTFGTNTVTITAFTPSPTSRVIELLDVSGFMLGDKVYLSNMPSGGSTALYATVSAITGNYIELSSDYITTVGATFPAGSMLTKVSDVTYDGANSEGVARNDGSGELVISPRASITFRYLDAAGNELSLPLSAATVESDLSSIAFEISLESERSLKSGNKWSASSERVVSLRNLILERN